jgi:S-methylmethionine-dependent homocysteine/selenocysteine methylase
MAKYRSNLPQQNGGLFLTDGGIETTLIFHQGIELPFFAAFDLLRRPGGNAVLHEYFSTYAAIAKRHSTGLILESATWRASADWAGNLGYTPETLADVNRAAVRMLEDIRNETEAAQTPVVISGCVGPRGDGYVPGETMSVAEATEYHRAQIETFADTAADMVAALTLNYTAEAIGIALAAERASMPVALSFTVETDGALPTGESLKSVIESVDEATSGYPVYYMINCAHPSHFEHVLATESPWMNRIRGVRANASCRSHAELNESPDLDIGNPVELGFDYARLKRLLPHLNVLGGCCGTDHRHVDEIARVCAPLFEEPSTKRGSAESASRTAAVEA